MIYPTAWVQGLALGAILSLYNPWALLVMWRRFPRHAAHAALACEAFNPLNVSLFVFYSNLNFAASANRVQRKAKAQVESASDLHKDVNQPMASTLSTGLVFGIRHGRQHRQGAPKQIYANAQSSIEHYAFENSRSPMQAKF